MDAKLLQIASGFMIQGKITDILPLGEGFINDTYKVFTDLSDEPSYILQRKNHLVFPDVPAMMENIRKVTAHIKAKVEDPLRETLTVIPTNDGKLCMQDEKGQWWAVTLYISGTTSPERADTPSLAYQGGLGLGRFHNLVSDFKEPLSEIIKGFHNIRTRFGQWDEALAADKAGRVKDLHDEIGRIESRRDDMLAFWSLFENGEIPTRVTHGDTKISNFLFNSSDGSLLCAIDLDTMMSSTLLCDTGDALRSYTNTGAEDDRDLDKVSMSIPMFEAYMQGYLEEMGDALVENEIKYLAFSGIYITYEQVLRFLMDYINGDSYYKTRYPGHNLVRTHAQYALLQSMEKQLPAMDAIVMRMLGR